MNLLHSSLVLCGLLVYGALSACDKGSWVPDVGLRGNYTSTANNTLVVMGTQIAGPAVVTITAPRHQSWTSTIDPPISYKDALTLNPVWEEYFQESLSETEPARDPIVYERSDEGYVTFTPVVRCSRGRGTCDGKEVAGEICTPFLLDSGALAGEYTITYAG
ncbi:hypothetical protein GE09DRAFT_590015 [Coniochaeta sp. 2T2.1]|nr:hypothetical protein GE09DRAFT_590015 [Coniochaeta sp. 2T2.1]